MQEFARLWERKDPYGEKRIPAMELIPLLWALGEPLGFGPKMPAYQIYSALELMEVPIYSDLTVRYEHVLQGLIRWGLRLNMRNLRFHYPHKDISRFTVSHLCASFFIA